MLRGGGAYQLRRFHFAVATEGWHGTIIDLSPAKRTVSPEMGMGYLFSGKGRSLSIRKPSAPPYPPEGFRIRAACKRYE